MHEVQRQPFVELISVDVFQLSEHALRPSRILLLKLRKSLFQVVITPLRTRALFLHVVVAGDLDENLLGRLTGNARDLVNNANSLVQTTPHSGRPRQIVHAERIASPFQIRAVTCVNLFLESEVVVMKNFHEHQGATTTAVRVWIAFAQNIHDGLLAKLSINLQPRKELSGKTTPASETLFAYHLDLLIVKTSATGRTVFLLKFFSKNGPIFK